MTLQQIADYAMKYLDSKGVAADYDIFEESKTVKVTAKESYAMLFLGDGFIEIRSRIRRYLLNY